MAILRVLILFAATGSAALAQPSVDAAEMNPEFRDYIRSRIAEFDEIPEQRRQDLQGLSRYVSSRLDEGQPARLNFICTHNSRRSQLCQIWAKAAAGHFRLAGVETFSGGTEVTAFNHRAVAALQRSGVQIEKLDETENPRYAVRFQPTGNPLICFSKVHDQPPNPSADFCAVMTCSNADRNCPLIEGSSLRVAIPYEDPKVADETPLETSAYDQRCRQICREMLYVFSQVSADTPD